jgi:hypothetical protein
MTAPVAVISNRLQRDRRMVLQRAAMQILLGLPADVDEAAEILQLAQELLDWIRHHHAR